MRKFLAGTMLLLAAAPAGAATRAQLASARAYVERLYRTIPGRFDDASVRYTPELAALIARDGAFSKASGDVGVIDGIPFCDCQDNAPNYRVLRSGVKPRGASGAVVTVLLRNDTVRRFTIDLTLSGGRWLVADIHAPGTPSFLAMLRREVPAEEKALQQEKEWR